MSKMNDNPLVQGARGNFGKKMVYRKRGNDTLMVKMPSVNKKRVRSDEEKAHQSRFKLAALFAKGAMKSAELKPQYKQKTPHNGNPFAVALKDYLTPPTIHQINASEYNGTAGSTLSIIADDDFRVVSATVTIRNAAGQLVEQGAAHLDPVNLAKWIYTATQPNAALAGSTIRVVVKDVPGNAVNSELTL